MIKWDLLGKIGNSKIMGLTIIMPLIGYMVIFNVHVVEYLNLSTSLFTGESSNGSVPAQTGPEFKESTRLLLIYYGLTLLGIASIIYQFFCPPLIKMYPYEGRYIESEIALMTNLRYQEMSKKLMDCYSEGSDETKKLKKIIGVTNEIFSNGKKNDEDDPEYKRQMIDFMSINWAHSNNLGKVIRFFVTIFYALGFAALAIPSIMTFVAVSKVFMN